MVINDVIVTPNNLRNEPAGSFFQDLYVQFTPTTTLPYDHDIKDFPKVMLVVPYGYQTRDLDNEGFVEQD